MFHLHFDFCIIIPHVLNAHELESMATLSALLNPYLNSKILHDVVFTTNGKESLISNEEERNCHSHLQESNCMDLRKTSTAVESSIEDEDVSMDYDEHFETARYPVSSNTIYAHRVILSGRSSAFARLFAQVHSFLTSQTPSNQQLIETIPNFAGYFTFLIDLSSSNVYYFHYLGHPRALSIVLHYIYAGRVDWQHFEVSSGSKHDVEGISQENSEISLESLSMEDRIPDLDKIWLDTLFLSRMLKLTSLYSVLLREITTNNFRYDLKSLNSQVLLSQHTKQIHEYETSIEPILQHFNTSPTTTNPRPESFLSTETLSFGAHQCAVGIYIRIPSALHTNDSNLKFGSYVQYHGKWFGRWKIDPLLLACRSDVFQIMFTGGWRESNLFTIAEDALTVYDNDIIIKDVSPEEFECIIELLYFDHIATLPQSSNFQFMETSVSSPKVQDQPDHSRAVSISQSISSLLLQEYSSGLAHLPMAGPLLNLLSFATLYCMPTLSDCLQQSFLPKFISSETLGLLWELGTYLQMDSVQEMCIAYLQRNFVEASKSQSFAKLSLSLLKSALEPGVIECDSHVMISAIEHWIDAAMEHPEKLEIDGSCEASQRTSLRLLLFPPSTLFNQAEKRRVLGISNRDFFNRMLLRAQQ